MDTITGTLNVIGALITMVMGAIGLLKPAMAMKITGLAMPEGVVFAISEVRATYGGLFLVLGLSALVLGGDAEIAAGLAWIGAAAARAGSIIYDQADCRENRMGVAFEAITGLLLIV